MKTDKFAPTDRQKAEVTAIIERWRPKLFLSEWYIWTEFSGTPHENDGATRTAAEVSIALSYKDCRMTIFKALFDNDSWQRERLIVHEMVHCLTDLTHSLAKSILVDEKLVTLREVKAANEVLTQQITNSIFAMDFYHRKEIEKLKKTRKRNRK